MAAKQQPLTDQQKRELSHQWLGRGLDTLKKARYYHDGLEFDGLIGEVIEKAEFIIKRMKECRT